jgi:hypothetical protein
VRARVWLDLKTPNQAKVWFAAGDQPATARRVVPTSARIDQVAAAKIAEIILAALTAPEGALVAEPSGESPPGLTAAAPPGAEPGTWVSRRCSNGGPPPRGLGRRALAAIELEATTLGVHAIHLGVRPENARALALYRASGYQAPPRIIVSKRLATARPCDDSRR